MSSSETLSMLGGDLAVSVSFVIANELRELASQHQVSESEIISVLLLLSILLGRVPSLVGVAIQEMRRAFSVPDKPIDEGHSHGTRGFLAFLVQVAQITQRITTNLLVQLVASTVVLRETNVVYKLLSLLTVAIFFIFVQNAAETSAPLVEGR